MTTNDIKSKQPKLKGDEKKKVLKNFLIFLKRQEKHTHKKMHKK